MKNLVFVTSLLVLSSGAAKAAEVAIVPVCERTAPVAAFIVNQINLQQAATKTCADITPEDLLTIERITVARTGITTFKTGDFSGLTNMKILNIRSNPYTFLIEGLFDGLDNLDTLVIIDTQLKNYPDDFLAATPKMKNLHAFRNPLRTISESVFQRLEALEGLEVIDIDAELFAPEQARLERIFAGTPTQIIVN